MGEEKTKLLSKPSTSRQQSDYGTSDGFNKKSKHHEKKKVKESVPITKMFYYATKFDLFLLFMGSIFAVIHGAGLPVIAIVFGQMTNTFIQQAINPFNSNDSSESSSTVGLNLSTAPYYSTAQLNLSTIPYYTTHLENSSSFSYYSTLLVNSSTVIDSVSTTSQDSSTLNWTTSKLTNLSETTEPTLLQTTITSILTSPFTKNLLKESAFEAVSPDMFNDYMNIFALYYVYIGLCVLIAAFFQVTCWVVSCERQIYRLRQEFFYQVLRQEIAWFDTQQSGELAMKLNDDLERVREGIGDKFSMFVQFMSTFITGFIVGFIKGWELTLVIMSMTPLLALSSAFLGKLVSTSTQREQQKYAVAGGIAEEVLANVKTVTAFCGQDREIKRYTDALIEGKRIATRKYAYMAVGFGFTFLVLYGTYALAFWYGSELILEEKMDAGAVFTVFFAVMIGSFSLGNAVPHLSSIATAKGSAVKVFNIIENVPTIDPYSESGTCLKTFKANIEFYNVNFFYPTRPTIQVLHDLTLSIHEGQTIALCGSSGSGKSTIISLLLRFYDPDNGRICLDGFDLKTLNVHWLRSIVGVVSQEPVLFGISIAENIMYGHSDVTFPEIVQAAKMANAHDFISSLPKGYDTMVGERGAQLSGGQKQRIAIARALVRDPKILLLDEATSALDAESEAVVQQALDKARQGRTTIIVAHRLSTIKDADVIYAMENGQIKEFGTHSDLMEKEGLYYQLVTNQMFVDSTGHSTSEMDMSLEYEKISKKRKQSMQKSVEWTRQLTRLESEVEYEDVDIPSGLDIIIASRPEWKYIALGCFASVIVGVSMPAFAIFYSEMFETFTLVGDALRKSAFFWSMMFIVLAVATGTGHLLRAIGFGFGGESLTMRLRSLAYANVLRQDIGWFDDDRHTTGKITTRLATDVPMVKSAAGHRIGTVVTAVVTMAASLVIAYIFGWKLALALTAIVPVLLFAGAIQMKIEKGNQRRDVELMADAGNVCSEALENIRTVQGLTLEPIFFEKYVGHLLLPYLESRKNAWVYAAAFSFSQAVMFFTYAAAFRLGAFLVTIGDMEVVNVYRVFFAMAFSAVSVGQWTSYLPDYNKAKLSAGLIFNMIKMEPKIDSFCKGGVQPQIKGEITLKDVHFRYPNRKNVLVLQGLSINVKPGQTLALVGPSGCGKSTVVSLIERFYDPENGQLKVDDCDIRTVNLQYLRSKMALVSQEPLLFNCSIKDNIIYGIEGRVSQKDIERAATTANIHNFVTGLPMKYDTIVGEKGTQLSGGQKQRIAIARALVRNPSILLLDEATSALDTESEKLVQEALDLARQGRTCIVIAHRLSTIQGADCIAVIEHGKVVETGTHEELLQKKGIYYKLIKRQRVKH